MLLGCGIGVVTNVDVPAIIDFMGFCLFCIGCAASVSYESEYIVSAELRCVVCN